MNKNHCLVSLEAFKVGVAQIMNSWLLHYVRQGWSTCKEGICGSWSPAYFQQCNLKNIISSAQHIMTTLLAEKMFTVCNSSPLKQHTVNHFLCFTMFSTAFHLVIQP